MGENLVKEKIKVAILGGGPSALAAAWELTNPDQNNAYDVTIHQLGWRLGGKCASGRDRNNHNRVEEHGLHVFFGYYDNAFEVLRAVYDERAKVADSKYKTIFDALEASDHMAVAEQGFGKNPGDWNTWAFTAPRMPGLPGEGADPDLWEMMVHGLELLYKEYEKLAGWAENRAAETSSHGWLSKLIGSTLAGVEGRAEAILGRTFREAKTFASSLLAEKNRPKFQKRSHDAVAVGGDQSQRCRSLGRRWFRILVERSGR